MKTLTDIGKIKMFFPALSKSTVKTFTELVTTVIQVRSTSLYKCKDKMKQVSRKKKTQAGSHYKKLLRFFTLSGMEKFCDCLFIFLVRFTGGDSNLLVMDRSNWKRGKKNINLVFFDHVIPVTQKSEVPPTAIAIGERSPLILVALHHFYKILEQILRIVRPGRRFRMVLNGEDGQLLVTHSL